MVRSGTKGVDFVAVNTDKQALNVSSANYKIQIGEKLTHGQGAGSDPEVGRKSAEESRSQIAKALEDTDMVFITARHGRRHRHRRRPHRGRDRQGDGHPHRGGGHQALRIRGPTAHAAGGGRQSPSSRTRWTPWSSSPTSGSSTPRTRRSRLPTPSRSPTMCCARRCSPSRPDPGHRLHQPGLRGRHRHHEERRHGPHGRSAGRPARARPRRPPRWPFQPPAGDQHRGRQGRADQRHRLHGHRTGGGGAGRQPGAAGRPFPMRSPIFGATFDETLDDEIRVTVIATGFDQGAGAAAQGGPRPDGERPGLRRSPCP